MFNRAKILKDLQKVTDTFFFDSRKELLYARELLHCIVGDHTIIELLTNQTNFCMMPLWSGKLDQQIKAEFLEHYTVFSVDGSQIYPDRHQEIFCYLINIGTAVLHYGKTSGSTFVTLHSDPFVKSGRSQKNIFNFDYITDDFVNCQRAEFEFAMGLKVGKSLDSKAVLLFDGSLIFRHLETQKVVVKDYFLSSYRRLCKQLHEYSVLHAAYISLSKSRELVTILACAHANNWYFNTLCQFDQAGHKEFNFIHCLDRDIVGFFLKPGHRTGIFKHRSLSVNGYDDCLRPYFFYLHNGVEIARIEIPAWIAQSEDQINYITAVIMDQCNKGRGYPVCLAEAHEQAVVKNSDREFFYYVLERCALKKGHHYVQSQKSIHKKGLGF